MAFTSCSVLINGLNSQLKRSMCLEWLKMHSIDVALIQETHFKHIDKHKLANHYYHTAAAACYNSKSCGVLVLLKRSLSLSIIDCFESDDGRITYIKTNICGKKVALFVCSKYIRSIILSNYKQHFGQLA
uniref:Endonuclease/exonuclease/phosphatase domain-containing protein n=1 Tax=Amphiprion percula TaxID=161767 RepID=A0A3P8SKD4_AMPPE